jgi:CubicO group peptidase (beta-lactamase class C family)
MSMDLLYSMTRAPLPLLGRCRVPWDLEEVRTIGHEVPARSVGLDSQAVERVWDAVEAFYHSGVHPAMQLCIRRGGRVVLHRALGHSSGNGPSDPVDGPKVKVGLETPINVFSASKAITAMVIHKLDERRALHLEDRVCDFIPGFEHYGKHRITLRHVLAHRAGIPNLPIDALDLEILDKPEKIMEILCDARLQSRPGRVLAYHAVSGGFVLAEVVRQATGHDIREVLAREILEPLGFQWTNFGVKPEDVGRVALNYATGPPPFPPLSGMLKRALGTGIEHAVELSNDPRFITGIIPSANVMTNAFELSAFYQCLLDEGTLDGVRVFDPTTVRHATTEQSYMELDLTLIAPLRYGLGFMLGNEGVGPFGYGNPLAFGHIGLSNTFSWADPERDIAVALVTTGKPLLTLSAVRLVQFLREVGNAFPKVLQRSQSRLHVAPEERSAFA